jgi:hypothetical protein
LVKKDDKIGGWFANETDPRDYEYSMIAGSSLLPSNVNLSKYLIRILFQGPVPSCVGHAIAHQIMIEEAISGIRTSIPSRAYIWAMSRKQHQEQLTSTGTYPRMAYKGISLLGCPDENYWKYTDQKNHLNTMPDDFARRHAMGRAGLQYYSIYGNRAEQIRQALSEGHPVSIGVPITSGLRNYQIGDILKPVKDNEKTYGGHYMCIVGYNFDHFIVVNSWRNSEFVLLDESFVEWNKCGDLTVCTGWQDLRG